MPPSPARRFVLLFAAAVTFSVAGCGPRMGQVDGQVVWSDGTPAKELSGGQVVFESDALATSARGEIDSEGRFRLRTSQPGDGAPVGDYDVAIVEHRIGREGSTMPPPKIDPRYYDLKTANLKATVKAGTNPVTLTVERAPK